MRDWTSPQNAYLWRNGIKTLFDPCPSGWRVPDGGDGGGSIWQAFAPENGVWTSNAQLTGYHWSTSVVYGGAAWFPANGYRVSASSPFTGNQLWIHLRSGDNRTFRVTGTEFTPNNYNVNMHGYSVRCIRE